MKPLVTLFAWSVALSTALAFSAEFYVQPTGDDANPGTKARPFATLTRARDAVRAAKSKGPVTVWVREGVYRLREPLVFGPADSGTEDGPITYSAYPGEKPVISGGEVITGWKRSGDGLWTVEIPAVKQGKWNFRQLFVNGQRRPRARLPEQGKYTVIEPPDSPKWSFQFQPGQIDPEWRNLDDVEVVLLQHWCDARLRIESIDTQKNVVRFTGMTWRPTTWSAGWFVENVYEGLTQPGQWYLDRKSGVLHYRPLPGEKMAEVDVVAPVARQWIRLEGDYKKGDLVQHIHFRGFKFHHTSWSLDKKLGYSYGQAAVETTPGMLLWNGFPPGGKTTPQSMIEVPAAIWAQGAHHLGVEGGGVDNAARVVAL